MPQYSVRSQKRLYTCHRDLRTIFNAVIEHMDVTILEGVRSKKKQNEYYDEGKTQLRWPDSKHNVEPLPHPPIKNPYQGEWPEHLRSKAVDVAPYPIDWNDIRRFCNMGFYVLGIAHEMRRCGKISHDIRWGADWDQDMSTRDENFLDYVHFELIET